VSESDTPTRIGFGAAKVGVSAPVSRTDTETPTRAIFQRDDLDPNIVTPIGMNVCRYSTGTLRGVYMSSAIVCRNCALTHTPMSMGFGYES